MKKPLLKPVLFPAVLVALYLFGLLLGAFAVSAYPIFSKQKPFFLSRTRTIAQEFLDGREDTLNSMSGYNTRILIYDCEGNDLRHMPPKNSNSAAGISLAKYLPAVLSGQEIFRPALAQETQRQLSDIVIVVGVPMQKDSQVVGAVFLVKNLMDLPEAVVGCTIYFTVFYWLSAYFIISNIRKKRKLDQLKQNYIANVTHAFKTPIASIKALSETLCDGVEPDPDKQKLYYGMILQEAIRQDHMVRNMLELSKLQSNGMDFTKSKVNACEVLAPVWEKYGTLCDCMGVSLHVSQTIAQLPPLFTNAACLKQILEILLDNAVKFVPEGGNIWIEAIACKKLVTFCVRDDGSGIAKDALPHIFERFYKCSHDFNESGSGLGLAIAQEIAAGLKEKLWAESEPGKGAAFFFTVRVK